MHVGLCACTCVRTRIGWVGRLQVTEDDRESKKDQIRAILKGWTRKKHGLFEDLRKTCKKHKEAVKAWKQQVGTM